MTHNDHSSIVSLESDNSLNSIDSQRPRPIEADNEQGDANEEVEGIEANETECVERHQSTSTNKLLRVPIANRRGLLAKLIVVPEYHDARECPKMMKLGTILIVAFAAITGPMGASVMLPAIDDIVKDFDTTVTMVNVSVGIYLLSLGIFPLWWSTFSERHGRRSVYLVSFVMLFAFSIGAALSPSINALIIFRVFCGGCSASVQAVGAGTVGDLYIPSERGTAMGIYYLGPLMGPFLSPILGGIVAEYFGWRATQWLLVIISGLNVILILFFLPETLRRQDANSTIAELLLQYGNNPDQGNNESGDGKEKVRENGTSLEADANEGSSVSLGDDGKEDNKPTPPADADNYMESHQFTPQELLRIASNISRQDSRRQSINIDGERTAFDIVAPTLSRTITDKSSYSRRLAHIYQADHIEMMHKTLSEKDEKQEAKWPRLKRELYDYVIRPTHSVILLKHPPVALAIAYSSSCFALMYFFNMSISYEYGREPYNFKTIIVGLLYIPNSVTYVIASLLGGRWNDRLLNNYARKHNGEMVAESRLSWNVFLAVVLIIPACLIFGWCLKFGEHWVTPLIGTALFGFASMLIIGATVVYLVDTLPGKGATGIALNNLVRQTLAAISVFIVEPLLHAIGPGILFTILMAIVTIMSSTLIVLKKNGPYYRENYDLSKLYEKL